MNKKPNWIKSYDRLNIDNSWSDDLIEDYDYSFVMQTDKFYSPFNNLEKNILLEDSEYQSVLDNISIPKPYTLSETMKFIFDTYSCLFSNIPKDDSQVYNIYKKANKYPEFIIDIEFEKFYEYYRKYQYMNIEKTKKYKSISDIVSKNTYDIFPIEGSKWKISHNNQNKKVVVEDFSKPQPRFVDSEVKCSIIDGNTKDTTIFVSPEDMNNGTRIEKSPLVNNS